MWYFAWILGLGLAAAFGILNAIWYEVHSDDEASLKRDDAAPCGSRFIGDPAAAGKGAASTHRR